MACTAAAITTNRRLRRQGVGLFCCMDKGGFAGKSDQPHAPIFDDCIANPLPRPVNLVLGPRTARTRGHPKGTPPRVVGQCPILGERGGQVAKIGSTPCAHLVKRFWFRKRPEPQNIHISRLPAPAQRRTRDYSARWCRAVPHRRALAPWKHAIFCLFRITPKPVALMHGSSSISF